MLPIQFATVHTGEPEAPAPAAPQIATPAEATTPTATAPPPRRIYIEWFHGLGDTIQFLTVLAALRNQSPSAEIVVIIDRGKHSAIAAGVYNCRATGQELPLAVQVYFQGGPGIPSPYGYEHYSLAWWENYDREPLGGDLVPQTKPITCLRRVFNIDPPRPFISARIRPRPGAVFRASQWLEANVGDRPFAILHYQGNTSGDKKDLSHEAARIICHLFRRLEMLVVLLDWDRRSPLPGEGLAICPIADSNVWGDAGPIGTGDAETIAALADRAAVCIGIDSGPLHVFLATCPEKTVGVWTHHHPHQFAEEGPALHLVPADWRDRPPFQGPPEWVAWWEGANRRALERGNGGGYRLREYRVLQGHHTGAMEAVCNEIVARFAAGGDEGAGGERAEGEGAEGTREEARPARLRDGWHVHQHQVAQDLIVINDAYDRDAYSVNHVHPPLQIPGHDPYIHRRRLVVDIGAHIGTFARKWHAKDPSAIIVCVEACAENIPVLRANVRDFAIVIHAACYYEGIDRPAQSVWLKNAITAASGCESTGGGIVANAEGQMGEGEAGRYEEDRRPLRVVTLEEIVEEFGGGVRWIDCLKLDCEGAEFVILRNSTIVLERQIGYIVGEYHGTARWNQLRAEIFRERDWDYGHMHQAGNFGIFHLRPQPQRQPQTTTPAPAAIAFAALPTNATPPDLAATATPAAPAAAVAPTAPAAPLRIALDWDDTYTRDPAAWAQVVAALTAAGHEVVLVTAREDIERNWQLCKIPGILAHHRYFTGHKPKREWMETRGVPVDIWIDDRPEAIVGADQRPDAERAGG
jgi:FkbM family methyltransferase